MDMGDEIENPNEFVADMQRAFPDYGFSAVRVGADWVRIFVTHDGISLGRISLEPNREGSGYSIGGFKHYKLREYEFETRDVFFHLFWTWHRTGTVPRLDFPRLVQRAKFDRKMKIAEILEWRRRNPKRKGFVVDSDGECSEILKRRRRVERAWMPTFRKLVAEELEKWSAE